MSQLSIDPLSGIIAVVALLVSIYAVLYARRADYKTKLERAKELQSKATINLSAAIKHAPEIKLTWQGAATLNGVLDSSIHALLLGRVEDIEAQASKLFEQLEELNEALNLATSKNISQLITNLAAANHAAEDLRLRCAEEQANARAELSDARNFRLN